MEDIREQLYQRDLCGERLTIRPFIVDDISERYISWLNDAEVVRYSNQRFRRHDQNSVSAYLQSFSDSPALLLAIDERHSKTMIGTMTIYPQYHHETADVGIMLGERSLHGQGYGREAWCLIINWLAEQCRVRKITAGTLDCNLSMVRLMKAAGMHHEATRYKQEIIDGKPADILLFARFSDA